MSFSGKSNDTVDTWVINDGLWPNLQVAEFQKTYRLPAEYALELVVDGLRTAMGEVNQDLQHRRQEFIALGIAYLEDAEQDQVPNLPFVVATYKRAVYCRAKADLLPQFATINRRPEATNLAKEAPETRELFLAYSQRAIRLLQSRGRITAVLL
ncbi:head completion/stabilization protein [Pseudomonas tohonis]|uniref:head completion/stabilization protein n=1 Tax=Pseudomonas solani TaxID=2731552 RepID=UPI00039818C6|nr:hypothetical protein L682_07300 [Pseudomonas alcaligenes OT 69]MDN4146620.1 head completion/stabilization protein [Pseudomonas tohonis]